MQRDYSGGEVRAWGRLGAEQVLIRIKGPKCEENNCGKDQPRKSESKRPAGVIEETAKMNMNHRPRYAAGRDDVWR
ncbi:MAG: hypothetical protein ABSG10_05175 [Terracidiphilus sp.]|jgi:hypothetical protein